MSTVRLVTNTSVIRLTPPPEGGGVVRLVSPTSVIRISKVGIQGPPGPQGDPGEDGDDGQAQIPEFIDGGNF